MTAAASPPPPSPRPPLWDLLLAPTPFNRIGAKR